MPRKISGSEISTIEPSMVAISIPSVVFDSVDHLPLYGSVSGSPATAAASTCGCWRRWSLIAPHLPPQPAPAPQARRALGSPLRSAPPHPPPPRAIAERVKQRRPPGALIRPVPVSQRSPLGSRREPDYPPVF